MMKQEFKIKSHIERFKDNALVQKFEKYLVFHWTGAKNLKGTLDWLDNRVSGSGTVAYSFIIDTKGVIHQLCNLFSWFHNTGSGGHFDKKTISIAFVSKGEFPTKSQIGAVNYLLNNVLKPVFTFKEVHCHREFTKKKPDFPASYWKKLRPLLDV